MDKHRQVKRSKSDGESPLKTERDYFASSVGEWVKVHDGKVALVKGTSLVGVYDTELNAVAAGARLYGTSGFLVRRIQSTGDSAQYPLSLSLGLLRGNSSSSPRG